MGMYISINISRNVNVYTYVYIYIYIICICVYAGETTDTFRGFLYFALIFFGYLLSKHPEYHGQLWFLVAHHSMFGDFGEPMT